MQTKFLPATIQKAAAEGFDATFVMSAASPDRYKDTIDPAAYDGIIAKSDTLIALWQHKHEQPLGTWHNLRRKGTELIGDLKLASTSLANMVRQLLLDGVPLGASIGFVPLDGKANKLGGTHFTAMDLAECSVCSVPANPAAVRMRSLAAEAHGLDPNEIFLPDAAIAAQMGLIDEQAQLMRERAAASLSKSAALLTRKF